MISETTRSRNPAGATLIRPAIVELVKKRLTRVAGQQRGGDRQGGR
jgi:hypothetical protein